ncbi:hypothetical protein SDC9_205494 [bioreactor metagenome]|uniref:Uncharacterized protein n=1 Tax=bioreactor metagenome TaxID=1076179 RepID=A0A645J3V5_9ZZZZ
MLDKDNEKKFIEVVRELSMGRAEVNILAEIYGACLNNEMIIL